MSEPPAVRPPVIPPVVPDAPRPLWSVMIPTFNSAHQVAGALDSVLCQAPSPEAMEIVVVDDASSDDIGAVTASRGPRVRLHRQPRNLGVPGNLIDAIRRSRGRLVHILHGDDMVRDGFYRAMERAFEDPGIGAAFSRQIFIDELGRWTGISPLEMEEDGRIPDALRFLATEQRIMTPSICVRREVYEQLGGFHPDLRCAEDWEMWVRIAKHFPVAYIQEPLALYRIQEISNTGRNMRTGADVDLTARAIEIIRSHLPADIAQETSAAARATYARSALRVAGKFATSGDAAAAMAQLRAALRMDRSPRTLVSAVRTLLRIGRKRLTPRRPGRVAA